MVRELGPRLGQQGKLLLGRVAIALELGAGARELLPHGAQLAAYLVQGGIQFCAARLGRGGPTVGRGALRLVARAGDPFGLGRRAIVLDQQQVRSPGVTTAQKQEPGGQQGKQEQNGKEGNGHHVCPSVTLQAEIRRKRSESFSHLSD